MGTHGARLISGLLRVAALSGAVAAFMLIAPGQANAADPLAPVADHAADVAEPLGGVAEPAVQLLEPVTDPVVEATKPITDPIVGTTEPIVNPIVERLEPIVEPLPSVHVPVPAIPTTTDGPRAAGDRQAAAPSPTLADAERSAPTVHAAPRQASLEASPSNMNSVTAATSVTAAARLAAPPAPTIPALTAPARGTDAPLPQTGEVLLVGVLAATLIGIIAGWRRLSVESLILPSSLALAPPVPPG